MSDGSPVPDAPATITTGDGGLGVVAVADAWMKAQKGRVSALEADLAAARAELADYREIYEREYQRRVEAMSDLYVLRSRVEALIGHSDLVTADQLRAALAADTPEATT